MANFQRNDVVQPVEGGPRMTVERVFRNDRGSLSHVYLARSEGGQKRRDFFFDQLKLVERSL